MAAKNKKSGHFWRILFFNYSCFDYLAFYKGQFSFTYKRRQFQGINLYLALSEVSKTSKQGCDVLIKTFQSQLRSWKNWEIAQEPIFSNSLNLSSPANLLSAPKCLILLLQQNVGGENNYLNGYAIYISIWIYFLKIVAWSSVNWRCLLVKLLFNDDFGINLYKQFEWSIIRHLGQDSELFVWWVA